jgi:hypothetical protein
MASLADQLRGNGTSTTSGGGWFSTIVGSSTSSYDDLLGSATEKYNAFRGIGNADAGVSEGSGVETGLFPKLPSGEAPQDTTGDFGANRMFGKAFGTPQANAYADMILEALSGHGWGEKQRKYAVRHGKYLESAAKDAGTNFVKIEAPKGYEGTVYVATGANGKRYLIDAPHSPGGNLLDVDLGEGAKPLGLGGLGGSGEYKNIPDNAGASYIAYDDYKGPAPKVNHYTDINVSEQNPLGFFAGIALAAVGQPWLAAQFGAAAGAPLMTNVLANAGASAITGGLSSAINGGNIGQGILTGGITGGLGSYLGSPGGLLPKTNDFSWNNVARGAITGATSSALRGGNIGTGLLSGAAGGAFTGNDVGTTLARTGTQLAIGSLFGNKPSESLPTINDTTSATNPFTVGTIQRNNLAGQLRSKP